MRCMSGMEGVHGIEVHTCEEIGVEFDHDDELCRA